MSGLWVVGSFILPVVAAVAAGIRSRRQKPPPQLIIGLNAVLPGVGLAAARRPTLEVVLGVLLAQASLLIMGGLENVGFYVPIMVIGGLWASVYTPFNPLAASTGSAAGAVPPPPPGEPPPRKPQPTTSAAPAARAVQRPPTAGGGDAGASDEQGYAVNVRCTECGADVIVPVLEHMARCEFCGSFHLVVGHEQTLYVTIPEKLATPAELREAVLDHYRYLRYLQLYKRAVSPIEGSGAQVSTGGHILVLQENTAAIAAAEAAVSRKADHYRQQLAGCLEIGDAVHFLAPYRHGTGTMYQAAFGRSKRDQEKRLVFTIGSIEASTLATDTVALPAMGKLSYLRALEPAAKYGEGVKALPVERDRDALRAAYGDLDRKQLVRELSIIRIGSAFVEEVEAVVWRPWWTAEVEAPGISETLLVDSAAGTVAGAAPSIDPELLQCLPEAALSSGSGLRFLPMECPTCGYEFPFDRSALIHFCMNCHRAFDIDHLSKRELGYRHAEPAADPAHDLVPFWEFPLAVRTGDGILLTDLLHLKDGIDGSFDQIGDGVEQAKHLVYVPAVRLINSKLMAKAFRALLLHLLQSPPRVTGGRFSLDDKVAPWTVSLDEADARAVLPLYLANSFSKRDIARVNIHQVGSWLFDAIQETHGRLTYLPIPRPVTEPFRRYVGRFHAQAVHVATKTGTTIDGL